MSDLDEKVLPLYQQGPSIQCKSGLRSMMHPWQRGIVGPNLNLVNYRVSKYWSWRSPTPFTPLHDVYSCISYIIIFIFSKGEGCDTESSISRWIHFRISGNLEDTTFWLYSMFCIFFDDQQATWSGTLNKSKWVQCSGSWPITSCQFGLSRSIPTKKTISLVSSTVSVLIVHQINIINPLIAYYLSYLLWRPYSPLSTILSISWSK
jgi:hypothetical protein